MGGGIFYTTTGYGIPVKFIVSFFFKSVFDVFKEIYLKYSEYAMLSTSENLFFGRIKKVYFISFLNETITQIFSNIKQGCSNLSFISKAIGYEK